MPSPVLSLLLHTYRLLLDTPFLQRDSRPWVPFGPFPVEHPLKLFSTVVTLH